MHNKHDIPFGLIARRFALTIAMACFALLVMRYPLSDVLISRGDSFFEVNALKHAQVYYARALAFNPHSDVAADRYVFVSFTLRTPNQLRDGIAMATRYLRKNPNATLVRSDRALCYLILRDYPAAYRDYRILALREGTAAMNEIAARTALRSRQKKNAILFFDRTLKLAPHYGPAVRGRAEAQRLP